MKFDYQEHFKSAFLTFGVEFVVYFLIGLQGTNDFTFSALLAIITTALRAVGKELLEAMIIYFRKLKNENKVQTIQEVVEEISSSTTTSEISSTE